MRVHVYGLLTLASASLDASASAAIARCSCIGSLTSFLNEIKKIGYQRNKERLLLLYSK